MQAIKKVFLENLSCVMEEATKNPEINKSMSPNHSPLKYSLHFLRALLIK